jgi:hypothetical protein
VKKALFGGNMATLRTVPAAKAQHQPTKRDPQWIYAFDELDRVHKLVGEERNAVLALLGGKGGNLAEMTRIGLPVPYGFTITTKACNAYLEAGQQLPDGIGAIRREVLDARHDGHDPEPRYERRDR